MRACHVRSRPSILAVTVGAVVLVSCGLTSPAEEEGGRSSSKASTSTTVGRATSSSRGPSLAVPSPSTQPVTTAPSQTTSTLPGPKRAPAGPFNGAGVWVDVYEWSPSSTDGNPGVTPDQVAQMAEAGMKTLYIQSARTSRDVNVADPERFKEFVDAAHLHGMKVVSWYLPEHVDEQKDLRRVLSPLDFGVDGVGVDLESAKVGDVDVRNQRAIALVSNAADLAGDAPVGAITFAPQALDRYEPETWPDFPWQQVADAADVVVPMAYWTMYRDEAPDSDDPVVYTEEALELLRERIGDDVPVHSAGGLLQDSDAAQVAAATAAARRHGAIGVSMYSWSGYQPGQMDAMKEPQEMEGP